MRLPDRQPILETPRLRLRPFDLTDGSRVEELAGDHRVADTTLSIPHPYPSGGGQAWIETHSEGWEAGTQVVWAVTVPDSGTLIGAIGLVLHPEHDRAELGYWIGVPYWNQGYATEAGRAVVTFAFEVLGLHRVHARHFLRNPASGAVMRKIGMRREGGQPAHMRRWDRYEDIELYGVLADNWPLPG